MTHESLWWAKMGRVDVGASPVHALEGILQAPAGILLVPGHINTGNTEVVTTTAVPQLMPSILLCWHVRTEEDVGVMAAYVEPPPVFRYILLPCKTW